MLSVGTRGVRGEWLRVIAENHCSYLPHYAPVSNPDESVSLEVRPNFNLAWTVSGAP